MMSQRGRETGGADLALLFREAVRLHQQGKLDAAAQRYGAALSADPRHFDALNLFGLLRAQQGRFAEAVELLRRAIARNPASGPAHNNLGLTLNLMQRPAEAIAPLERATTLNPRDPLAHNNLGTALETLGRLQPAAASFARAVALKPDYVEALSNLGAARHALGRSEEAVPLLSKAVEINPGFVQAHLNLGIVLHALDRSDEAMACLARALAADPRSVRAYGQIGEIHLEKGDFDEARRCYQRALDIEPGNARILYNLVQSGRVEADDPHLATLEALAENPGALPEDQRISLHFALGKAYADLGQDGRGFLQIRQGCALKRRRVAYDEAGDLGLFERIRTVFSVSLMASRAGLGNPSERPIFILGMMRSGSTLVEQILASHPDVHAAGERPDLNEAYKAVRRTVALSASYPEIVPSLTAEQLRQIGDAYLARIEARTAGRAKPRVTDKMPGNFSAIGLIRLALPNARIIHTVRDPIDTCLSCFSKLFAEKHPFTYDLAELGRYYRAYARLMDHWRAVLPTEAFLDVHYEELVGDFENQVHRLLDYCGLPWNAACLSFYKADRPVRTASQVQVRQPIYQSSVGRWRPDPALLRPLLEGLGIAGNASERGADAGTGER